MPMSRRRVTPPAALFVCRVEKTRCPVRALRMVISAVSGSRTSPTIMMSGSWRSIDRSPWAKEKPILGWTWSCVMPVSWYSMGSSIVRIFTFVALSFERQA